MTATHIDVSTDLGRLPTVAIVAKVAEGNSNKQLASGLGISVRTVAKHMENILAKSGSESRTELCSRVHHEGFISLRPPAARV